MLFKKRLTSLMISLLIYINNGYRSHDFRKKSITVEYSYFCYDLYVNLNYRNPFAYHITFIFLHFTSDKLLTNFNATDDSRFLSRYTPLQPDTISKVQDEKLKIEAISMSLLPLLCFSLFSKIKRKHT